MCFNMKKKKKINLYFREFKVGGKKWNITAVRETQWRFKEKYKMEETVRAEFMSKPKLWVSRRQKVEKRYIESGGRRMQPIEWGAWGRHMKSSWVTLIVEPLTQNQQIPVVQIPGASWDSELTSSSAFLLILISCMCPLTPNYLT